MSSNGLSGSGSNLEDSQSARYMLDIHLFKGTTYVFMDFVRKFMHVLTSSCSVCTRDSFYSGSNHSSQADVQSVASPNRQIMNSSSNNTSSHHHDYKLKIVI